MKGRGDRGCHRLCPFSVPRISPQEKRGVRPAVILRHPCNSSVPPRGHSGSSPTVRLALQHLAAGRTSQGPGLSSAMAAGNKGNPHGAYLRIAQRGNRRWEAGGAREPATRARRDKGEVTGTLTPRDWGPLTPAEKLPELPRGDTTHASPSHFLWRPSQEGKKRLLRPQGNGTCASTIDPRRCEPTVADWSKVGVRRSCRATALVIPRSRQEEGS